MKMKLNISSTFFTLFLLSTTISHLPSATADYVVDTNGEPLHNGGAYYVMPAIFGIGGGGLTLATTGNEPCPLSVVQSPLLYSDGSAVVISSPVRFPNIYEGLKLGMSFRSLPDCAPANSRWTVFKDAGDGKLSIKLSGGSEHDDESRVAGWFNIEKNGYYGNKITFCADDSERCEDVGVRVDENGVRSLVVVSSSELEKRRNPLVVQFKRARSHHHHDDAYDA